MVNTIDEASPRPWRVIRAFEDEPARVIDSNDEDVAIELTDADAALIVDAVNGLRSKDAPAGFDPYCAHHGCQNCRIYARLEEAKQKEESK